MKNEELEMLNLIKDELDIQSSKIDKFGKEVNTLAETFRKDIILSDCKTPIVANNNGREVVLYPCDPRYCTTCNVCEFTCPTSAIKKSHDEEGFYCIKIEAEKCIGCKKCIDVCHVNKTVSTLTRVPRMAYACRSRDREVLQESSSGGMFSEFAKAIISREGLVCGAAFDKDNRVCSIMIDNMEDLKRLRGSKYVQSDLGTIISDVKQTISEGRTVLFVGTPCQVGALRQYVGVSSKLISIDFACHGVASPLFFEDYKTSVSRQYGNLKDISFRKKDPSWKDFSVEITTTKDKYKKLKLNDMFMRAYLSELVCRPVCHRCKYAQNDRLGDITICDYWGYDEDGVFNDGKGVSACLLNTDKGINLFNSITTNIEYHKTDIKKVIQGNLPLRRPSLSNTKRSLFWDDYRKYGYDVAITHWVGEG